MPSPEVRVPFALQGLIGTLAGPEDPGTAFVGFYHELGEAAGAHGRVGLRARRDGRGDRRAARRGRGAPARGSSSRRPSRRCSSPDGRAARPRARGRPGGRRAGGALQRRPAAPRRGWPACRGPPGWRQAGPVVKVMLLLDGLPDFPSWPGPEPWAGAIDIGYSLEDLARAAADARAGPPGGEAVDRGGVPDGGRPDARAGRAPRPVAVLPVLPARRGRRRGGGRGDRPLRAGLPRAARTASWTASRSGRASSRRASASRAGTSSTARCCPASASSSGRGRAGFGGVEGLYLGGSGAHPGGAVTGAPGLARRAGRARRTRIGSAHGVPDHHPRRRLRRADRRPQARAAPAARRRRA